MSEIEKFGAIIHLMGGLLDPTPEDLERRRLLCEKYHIIDCWYDHDYSWDVPPFDPMAAYVVSERGE